MEWNEVDWSGCPLIESIKGKRSGDPVFVGSRLPVSAVIENYDDFLEGGMTPDEAVAETLATYPTTRGGATAIRAVSKIGPHTSRFISLEDDSGRTRASSIAESVCSASLGGGNFIHGMVGR